jgi:FMN phosphatase YigB (HAD superfamily)
MPDINTIIFDLGGVLIDWNPIMFFTMIILIPRRQETISLRIFVRLTGMKTRMPVIPLQKQPKRDCHVPGMGKRDQGLLWTLDGNATRPDPETVEIFRELKQNPD